MNGFTENITTTQKIINVLWILGKFFLIATAFSFVIWVFNFPFEFSFDLGFVQATAMLFWVSLLCLSLSLGIYTYWYHYFGGKKVEDLQDNTKDLKT